MPQNVVVRFTTEIDPLKEAEKALHNIARADEEIYAIDQKLQKQVDQTNDALAKRDKEIQNISQQKKTIGDLANAFGNLTSRIVGASASNALKDIAGGLKSIGDLRDKIAQRKDLLNTTGDTRKIYELNKSIEELEGLLAKVGRAGKVGFDELDNSLEQPVQKASSLRQELRALREEIAQKKLAGAPLQDIQALIDKAGELDDTLKDVTQQISVTGSDTRNIEGVVQIMGAATAAVSGLQAAQALLGAEDEELQKILAKLNALLLLSNSIQQIQTALQKESAAIGLITNAQRKIGILLTQLQTAAESEYTVVRYAATAAQYVLNAAMKANPAGLLLTVVAALATAVLYFTSTTDDAAEAQKKLNDQLEEAIKYNDDYDDVLDKSNEKIILRMKLAGAADQQIREQELRNAKKKLDNQKLLEQQAQESYDKSKDLLAKEKKDAERYTGATTTGLTFLTEEQRKEVDRTIKAYEEINQKKLDLQHQYDILDLQNQLATQDEIEKFNEDVLKQQEQNYQKNKTARDKRSTEQKTLAERDRKAAQAIQRLALEDQIKAQEEIVNSQTAAPTARLTALQESFELSKQLLREQRDFELKSDKLTGNERKLIIKNYLSDMVDLEREYGKRVTNQIKDNGEEAAKVAKEAQEKQKQATSNKYDPAEGYLQDQIDVINSVASAAGASGKVLRDIHRQTYDYNKMLSEIEAAEDRERLKNKEIDQIEFNKNELDREKNLAKELLQIEIDKIEERKEKQLRYTEYADQLGQLFFANQQARLQEDLDKNQQLYDKRLISDLEYNTRKNQIAKEQAAAQKAAAVYEIAIQLAKAIFAVQAQAAILGLAPPPLGPLLEAKALIQIPRLIAGAAIQSAFVLARKYKHGKIDIDGPGTETSDSIPAWISKRESVINAKATKENSQVLKAINEHRYERFLIEKEMPRLLDMIGGFRLPKLPSGAEKYLNSAGGGAGINNKALAKDIAREIANELPKKMPKQKGINTELDLKTGMLKIYSEDQKQMIYTAKKLNR